MKQITYKKTQMLVDLQNVKIFYPSGKEIVPTYNKAVKRWFICFVDKYGKRHCTTRARIICLAKCPKTPQQLKHLQAAHIDDNQVNDNPSNLMWLTCQQNNSTDHKRQLASKHAHRTDRTKQMIHGVSKTGEEMWFINARAAAKYLKCSHVLVHYALSPDHWVKTAKGWHLEYVKRDDNLLN